MNTLNRIKNAWITKQKRRTPKQKELLNLFDDFSDTILTDKTLKLESQEDDENENENVNENVNVNENENEYVNENVNENDKTLMSSDKDDDDDDDDDDDENEIINQNNSDKIKELNDHLDEIIDKSKSFENQIKSINKSRWLLLCQRFWW